jgi:hypothetical protein
MQVIANTKSLKARLGLDLLRNGFFAFRCSLEGELVKVGPLEDASNSK